MLSGLQYSIRIGKEKSSTGRPAYLAGYLWYMFCAVFSILARCFVFEEIQGSVIKII